jgi:hypothetical protein
MQHRIAKLPTMLIPKKKYKYEHDAIKFTEKVGLNQTYKID